MNEVYWKEDMECFGTRKKCDDVDCTRCPNYKDRKPKQTKGEIRK